MVAGLDENCTASVEQKESGTYKAIQDARDIHYVDDRNQFDSDEQFASFLRQRLPAGSRYDRRADRSTACTYCRISG